MGWISLWQSSAAATGLLLLPTSPRKAILKMDKGIDERSGLAMEAVGVLAVLVSHDVEAARTSMGNQEADHTV